MARSSRKQHDYSPTPSSPIPARQCYRTALYARLSSEEKLEDSIETQFMIMRRYLDGKPQLVLCGEYADNGFTGTNFQRPGFQLMLSEIRGGLIDCVIVKDLSRLGRNYIETGQFIEKLAPMLNLRIIAVNDGFDSQNASALTSVNFSLVNVMNDLYAKDISRKICTALQGKLERGEFIGDYAPYGYQKDPANRNHLIPDPALVETVRRIFQMRAEGMGISRIAATLNREDIPSPGRYRFEHGIVTNNNRKGSALLWNCHVLTDLLHNVVYVGDLAQARHRQALCRNEPARQVAPEEWGTVRNTHEAIISRELFERVQAVNAQRTAAAKGGAGRYDHLPKGVNPFGKRLLCADCGSVVKLVRSISHKGDKAYFTYRCSGYLQHGTMSCKDRSISQADLEQAVLTTIRAHVSLFLRAREVIDKLRAEEAQSGANGQRKEVIRRAEQRLRRKETLRAESYMDLKQGLINDEEFQIIRDRYTQEILALQSELEAMRRKDAAESAPSRDTNWGALVEKYAKLPALTAEVVDAFVSEIRLLEDGGMEITLNYMDEFNAALAFCRKRGKEVA